MYACYVIIHVCMLCTPSFKDAARSHCKSNHRQRNRYSETRLETPLPWETTCLEGPPVLHRRFYIFSVNYPVTKDHLSWETTFLWPVRWSFKTGSTVYLVFKWTIRFCRAIKSNGNFLSFFLSHEKCNYMYPEYSYISHVEIHSWLENNDWPYQASCYSY